MCRSGGVRTRDVTVASFDDDARFRASGIVRERVRDWRERRRVAPGGGGADVARGEPDGRGVDHREGGAEGVAGVSLARERERKSTDERGFDGGETSLGA